MKYIQVIISQLQYFTTGLPGLRVAGRSYARTWDSLRDAGLTSKQAFREQERQQRVYHPL